MEPLHGKVRIHLRNKEIVDSHQGDDRAVHQQHAPHKEPDRHLFMFIHNNHAFYQKTMLRTASATAITVAHTLGL